MKKGDIIDSIILEIYILVGFCWVRVIPKSWRLFSILAETIYGCTAAKAYSDCKCGEFLICHRDQYCHGIISGRSKACEYHPENGKLWVFCFHPKQNCVKSEKS